MPTPLVTHTIRFPFWGLLEMSDFLIFYSFITHIQDTVESDTYFVPGRSDQKH